MENFDAFLELISNEELFSVVNTVLIFGPLNVTIIADLLEKSKATTLRIVQKAVESNFLIKDENESKKHRGFYYKITNYTLNLFKITQTLDETTFQGKSQENIKLQVKKVIYGVRSIALWQSTLGKIVTNYMLTNIDQVALPNKEKGIGDNLVMMQRSLNIKTEKEMKDLQNVITKFTSDIKEIPTEKKGKIPTSHILSLSLFPISEIHPIKEKRVIISD